MTERILIVDDEARNVRLFKLLLSPQGYRLDIAQNGEEALAKIEAAPPDLVLLDIMMPGMDGFEVCRRLRGDPRFFQWDRETRSVLRISSGSSRARRP